MRTPISVGYLLARISDTIADTAGISSREKQDVLDEFREWVCGDGKRDDVNLEPFEDRIDHSGERALLEDIAGVVRCYRGLDEPNRESVKRVVDTIISGQKLGSQQFRIKEMDCESARMMTRCLTTPTASQVAWGNSGRKSVFRISVQNLRIQKMKFSCGRKAENSGRDCN